jgi:hypothetical protein
MWRVTRVTELSAFCLTTILVINATVLLAQDEKPEPPIVLTIAEWHHELGPRFNRVSINVANISDQIFFESGCAAERGFYRATVTYEGVRVEEKDAEARRKFEKEVRCTQELGTNPLEPGVTTRTWLDVGYMYDMSKPGTYEVTISRETDPEHPAKSQTVKSNTLTVVVPAPNAPNADRPQ